jgi:hypothetical protein
MVISEKIFPENEKISAWANELPILRVFYKKKYDDPCGQCRRYAPHPDTQYPNARSTWPEVGTNSWCGEYEQKAKSPSPEDTAKMKQVMEKQIR